MGRHRFGYDLSNFGNRRIFAGTLFAWTSPRRSGDTKERRKIRQIIRSHTSVNQVVELLTMHLAPKQILVNAHISLRDDLTNKQVVESISEIEKSIKGAEPKVDMIFLETSSLSESATKAL